MRKGSKWIALIATGLFLVSVLTFPVQAATPEALEAYSGFVQEVMTEDGQIGPDDRHFLDEKRDELALTDEEANSIEEEVRLARKSAPSPQEGQNKY